MKYLLLLFVSGCAVMVAAEPFWNKTDPSQWSRQQIIQLETSSPWAKQVTAELLSNTSNMAEASTATRGGRSGRYSSRGSEPAESVSMPKFQALVQWISAAPIRAVARPVLPPNFSGHYVIRVSGLPLTGDMTRAVEDTTLTGKRGNVIHPESAYQDPGDTAAVYFAFLPSMVDGLDARTLVFNMSISPYAIKAKFTLSEMKYRGEIAL